VSREKQKRTKYTGEFKRQALERMQVSDNIVQLAQELGVRRPLLYQWEAAAEGRGRKAKRPRKSRPPGEPGEASEQQTALREEVAWLREALARKVKEADFFRGALQKVEARRQSKGGSGATGSTTKSGQ
jgi:transposase-like protein